MTTFKEACAAASAYQFSPLKCPPWLRSMGIEQDAEGYFLKVITSEPVTLSPTFNGVRVIVEVEVRPPPVEVLQDDEGQ